MAEPKQAAGFDADPSLRHRTLWNQVIQEMGADGVEWCADLGKPHEIDDPRDLCLNGPAIQRYGWDGTASLSSSPALLKLITDGNAELEKRRRRGLELSTTLRADVVSTVDTSHLTQAEREVIQRLLKAEPLLRELDIAIKDWRGVEFARYLEQKGDALGQRAFEEAHYDACSPALGRVAPDLIPYCSPLDFFPNKRPTMDADEPTELVPADITQAEIEGFPKFVPGDPMWNPYLMPSVAIARDPTTPSGWKWMTLSQEPRYQRRITDLADIVADAAATPNLDPSLAAQLETTAATLRGPNPFGEYNDQSNWVWQRSGNLEIGVGLGGGYSPMGKVSGAGLTIGVVRKGEADFLQQQVFPRLQQAEERLAALMGGGYVARPLSSDAAVRVVDVLKSTAAQPFTTLAFIGPDAGPLARAGQVKSVILANHHAAKFDKILKPMAELAITPEQTPFISQEHFVLDAALHESSHAIGPRSDTTVGGKTLKALIGDDLYLGLEESKANTGGLVVLRMIRDAKVPGVDDTFMKKAYATYVAGLFRQMRFGKEEAHGAAAWAEVNFLMANGAVTAERVRIGKETQTRLRINFEKIPGVIEKLWAQLATIQANGDRAAATAHLKDFDAIPEAVEMEIFPRLAKAGTPTDVKMVYREVTR